MPNNPTPKPLPPLNIPTGTSTCSLSIIDTTCSLVLPCAISVGPPIPGHKWMNVPVWAFHITHLATGTQLVFDLGCRKDWWNLVPRTVELLEGDWAGLRVERDISDVLGEGGVGFGRGGAGVTKVVLSHSHFDHVGNLSALPKEVEVIVGPGFKEAQMPGYPSNASSSFLEADFAGREVFEVPFEKGTKIGKMENYDLFGDGSLQILNAPGHAVAHICALVRTTEESYVLLGGDTCHFVGKLDSVVMLGRTKVADEGSGAMRPSEYRPMTDPLPEQTFLDKRLPSPCPCSIFAACHRDQEHAQTKPCYDLVPPAFPEPELCAQSLAGLAEFDADDSVLVIVAHDTAPADVLPFFPNNTITDWKRRGYKEKMHFHFVNELPIDRKVGREPLVDGVYRDGVRIKTLDGEKV